VAALKGIGPQDEIEGMLATQMVAAHEAAMECYRRSMLPEQTFEGRQATLQYAAKMSRLYADLMLALGKHRGKGQQVVRVEHVHVTADKAIVAGTINHAAPGGAGGGAQSGEQPHAIAYAPEPALSGALSSIGEALLRSGS
jgi:hypothetical protein